MEKCKTKYKKNANLDAKAVLRQGSSKVKKIYEKILNLTDVSKN